MFTHLRQSAQGFFAKLILCLLIAMFVLWGIGDVFRGMGGGPNNIATVGKKTITAQEFHNYLQRRPGQVQQVLSGLINNALIEQNEASLGIMVNDDVVVDFIAALPEFHDKEGRFDKALYQKMLMSAGTSEAHFVEDIRHEIAAKLIVGVFTGWVQVPEEMVLATYRAQEEQRTASLYYIPASAVSAGIAPPAEQEIAAYYDKHSKDFLAPEYRTLTYVTLPLADVQSKIDVPADDIKRVYDERKDDFRQPDKREVDDLQFDDEQDAKEAAAKIAKDGFAKAAPSAPVSNKGKTAKGPVAMQELPPEAGANVFALPQDGVTSPMLVNFAWHIYHAGKMVPGRTDTLEEARPVITSEIASHGAQETAIKLINSFEDALASGQTLDAAGEKIGQKSHVVGPVNHDGITPEGTKAQIPPYTNFISVAFSVAEGDHSQAVQAADGSYFLVRVDKVQPAHVKPLTEVKTQVAGMVLAEKTQASLQKATEKLSEQLRAGKNPAEALAASGLSVQAVASGNFKRGTESVPEGSLKDKPLPRGLISEVFRSGVGQSTHAYPSSAGGYMIATLTNVIPAPVTPNAKATDAIRDELKATLADEILHQYLFHLRNTYPVSINAAALGVGRDGNVAKPPLNEDIGE